MNGKKRLIAASFCAAACLLPASASSSEIGKETGYWAIFASWADPNDDWYADKMGTEPASKKIYREADKKIAQLKLCGVVPYLDWSNLYDSFTPHLVVLVDGPYKSKAAANAVTAKAKKCKVSGYAKYAVMIPPQPGED